VISTSWNILFIVSVLPFYLGLFIGKALTDLKWRRNALDYRRMESGGKLYKVSRVDLGGSKNDDTDKDFPKTSS
jgi:hypothetical protein